MPFTIPNTPATPTAEQSSLSGLDSGDLTIVTNAFNGYNSVVQGCAVTANNNLLPSVAAGQVIVNGLLVNVAAGTVTVTTADSTNPRIDLVCVDNTGTKSVVAGTPVAALSTTSAGPVFPTFSNKVVLAAVYVAAGSTSIATADIVDKRIIIPNPQVTVARQADATAVNSGTTGSTLTNDDTLFFPVLGNSTDMWYFDLFIIFSAANANMDFKAGFSFPSGTTMLWGLGDIAGASVSGAPGYAVIAPASSPGSAWNTQVSTVSLGTIASVAIQGVHFAGWVFAGGTAGNVAFQWAQATPDASNLFLKKGSLLRLNKLA